MKYIISLLMFLISFEVFAQKIEKVWYLDSVYYKTYNGDDTPTDPDVINYLNICKNQVFLQLGENSKVKIADFLCTLEKKEPAYFEGT